MNNEILIPEYIRPLIACKVSQDQFSSIRFVGTCFFISKNGAALTCSHIIENLENDEQLVSYDFATKNFVPVKILFKHSTADFAICQLFNTSSKSFELRNCEVLLGRDVVSYGYFSSGVSNGTINLDYRVMKGHISRIDSQKSIYRSDKIVEVSFQSLPGFSGAPIFDISNLNLLGMLFGNVESSIEVFSTLEVVEGNKKYAEKIHKLIEYGVGHSIDTLINYLTESTSYVEGSSCETIRG